MQAQMLKANGEPLSNGHPKSQKYVYIVIYKCLSRYSFYCVNRPLYRVIFKKHLKSLEVMCKILLDHLLSITMSWKLPQWEVCSGIPQQGNIFESRTCHTKSKRESTGKNLTAHKLHANIKSWITQPYVKKKLSFWCYSYKLDCYRTSL